MIRPKPKGRQTGPREFGDLPVQALEATLRYRFIGEVVGASVSKPEVRPVTGSDRADRVLTHGLWGSLVFLGVSYLVFAARDVTRTDAMTNEVREVLADRHRFDAADVDAIGVWDTTEGDRIREAAFLATDTLIMSACLLTLLVGAYIATIAIFAANLADTIESHTNA